MRRRRGFLPSLLALFPILVPEPAGAAESLATLPTHSTNSPVAQELRKLQLGPGLHLEPFALEPLVLNPVAFSIDGRGRVFVAETHRYGPAVFDITANTPWLLDDLSARTVHDRARFLSRTFATNQARLTNAAEIVRLVEDRNRDGQAETASVFFEGFREAVAGPIAGVLAQGTNVWVTCIPDLWKFAVAEAPTNSAAGAGGIRSAGSRLATGLGVHISVSGHDVHGLIRGPDGRIYFSFGDRGVCVTNREGAVLESPDSGGVLRCEPDGRDLELFCVGLRNPQELAFDDWGNLWTVDNDTAGADPCRVLHLVEGGDYGWRSSYQHMKGFGPWVVEELWRGGLDAQPAPAGMVSQGPAGLAFHPGTGRLPGLAGKFLHADFPGGIWAFDVKAQGATYALATKEKVLWNCWPTDVEFGPDGALYVLDWVQGWTPPGKGRIYRLTELNSETNVAARAAAQAEVESVRRWLAEGMKQRRERELAGLLGHADRRIRLEAQWELAERGTNVLELLTQLARSGPNLFSRLHALWGTRQIVRALPANLGAAELASLLPLLEDPEPEIRGQTALALGEGQLFNAERPMASLLKDSSARVRMLAIQGYTARFRSRYGPDGVAQQARTHFSSGQKVKGAIANNVARVLGTDPFTAVDAVGATVTGRFPAQDLNRMLPANRDEPFVTHAVVEFLARTRRNNAFESHFEIEPSAESALTLLWAQRRAGQPAISQFLTNPEPRLVLEAARAINDVPIPEALPALAALLEDLRLREPRWGRSALSNIRPAGPFSNQARTPRDQVLRRALNAQFRLGKSDNARALATFADAAHWPAALRAEALFLLGAWEVLPGRPGNLPIKPGKAPNHGSVPSVNPENWPGWFDRVVGLWRPLSPRPSDDARLALAPSVRRLIAAADSELASAAIDAAIRLKLSEAGPALLARLRDPAAPVVIRNQILPALAALGLPGLGDAIPVALADSNATVRASALPYLQRLEPVIAMDVLEPILRGALGATNGLGAWPAAEVRLAQAALQAFADLDSLGALALRKELQVAYRRQQWPAELELELLEMMEESAEAKLPAGIDSAASTNLAGWRPILAGGDAERGRVIFLEKVEVQCSRCHQIKRDGGTVGPALDGIGGRQTRAQLLESILRPNQTIAAGFESVLLTLKTGADHAGVVKGETATDLRLESMEEGLQTIPKADIAERRRSLSAMPEGLAAALSRRELRDLIEFLARLK